MNGLKVERDEYHESTIDEPDQHTVAFHERIERLWEEAHEELKDENVETEFYETDAQMHGP